MAFYNFIYWLNLYIILLCWHCDSKKYLFWHTFSWDLRLFSVLKDWRQFNNKNHHVIHLHNVDSSLLQDNTNLFLLHLESLIELFLFFKIQINFWNVSWTYSFLFNIKNIKNNCPIILLERFPDIYFWWIIYSFSIIFIYKRFNIWNFFWIPLNFFII